MNLQMNVQPQRIEPTEGNPEPLPPVGGLWSRDEDGGLRPADRATALAAGLAWADPEGEAPEAKKRAR